MSATNHTANYNLPIYIPTDKPKYLTDFNNAMNIIDSAIKGVADSIPDNVTEIQEQLAQTTQTANNAKNTADTAKSTADTAKSTADTAKSTADTANETATQNENVLATFFEGFTNWENLTPST